MTLDTAKKSQTETPFLMTTSKAKPGTPLADRVRDQTKELPVAPSACWLFCSFRSPRETCLRPRKLIPNCCEKLDWRNFCLALKYWLKQLLDDSSASIVYEVCECVCAAVLLGVGGVSACTVDTLTPWRVYCLPSSAAGTCSLSRSVCVPVYWYLFWPIRLIKQQKQTPDERKSQVLTVLPTFVFLCDVYPRPGNNIAIFSSISVPGELNLILQL